MRLFVFALIESFDLNAIQQALRVHSLEITHRFCSPAVSVSDLQCHFRFAHIRSISSSAKVSHKNVERTFCPCRNGGFCSTNGQSRTLCQCQNGFTGLYCETAIATRLNTGRVTCNQLLCQNGGTCQEQGFDVQCNCKPGYTGQRCENGSSFVSAFGFLCTHLFSEYFHCQGNGRFTDILHCKQGRYFECVYYGQRT